MGRWVWSSSASQPAGCPSQGPAGLLVVARTPGIGSFWAVNVSLRRDHLAYVVYLPILSQAVVEKTSTGMMGMW